MILPTMQIPISLDIFDFNLRGFTKDYQQYISDERIAVKTEKKKEVCVRYEILFCEEYNIVNNYPGAIFGQIESIVINDTLIEIRAAVIRMEEVPYASDFFSKFYIMVQKKWDVIHYDIYISDEFHEYYFLEEVNPEVNTRWNGEGDAVVYAYGKLERQSGIDSKYLPYIPYNYISDFPGDLILCEPIEDPRHQQHDNPVKFWKKYMEFKEELNYMLFPFTESYNTAFPNQTKSGKKGPADRIKKRAERFWEIKEKNPSKSRAYVAKKSTEVYKEEIEAELREKYSNMRQDEVDKKVEDEFEKDVGRYKTEYTEDDVRYGYDAMGWDWIPAKKGK